jgi:hypothetical protein
MAVMFSVDEETLILQKRIDLLSSRFGPKKLVDLIYGNGILKRHTHY